MNNQEAPGARSWTYCEPASPMALAAARHQLKSWIERLGGDSALNADVSLACYEAMANVLDHAYPAGTGPLEMRAMVLDKNVVVVVADRGRWQPPGRNTGRGRGLKLIQAVSEAVNLTSTETGTTVTMSWRL